MSQLNLLFKNRILSIHQLNQHHEFVIGNNPDSNIYIDSLAISPKHAKIHYDNHSYVIEELENESDILVNDKKVDSDTHLSDGDRINIGKHTLIFSFNERNESHNLLEPEPTPAKKHGSGWIQYLNGGAMGKTKHIKQSMVNIADENEQNIALISNRTDGFYLSYLKGNQPPTVNNACIGEKSVQLENNCKISVGSLKLLFYIS